MVQQRKHQAMTQGSLALATDTEQDYQEVTERFERRAKQTKLQVSVKAKSRFKARSILFALLFFAAVFFLLYRQVGIEREIIRLDTLRTELKQETRKSEDLRLALSLKLDIEKVQTVAKEEMHMNYAADASSHTISIAPMKTNSTAQLAASQTVVAEDTPATLSAWINMLKEKINQ